MSFLNGGIRIVWSAGERLLKQTSFRSPASPAFLSAPECIFSASPHRLVLVKQPSEIQLRWYGFVIWTQMIHKWCPEWQENSLPLVFHQCCVYVPNLISQSFWSVDHADYCPDVYCFLCFRVSLKSRSVQLSWRSCWGLWMLEGCWRCSEQGRPVWSVPSAASSTEER